jgi:hypothetical protein
MSASTDTEKDKVTTEIVPSATQPNFGSVTVEIQ